MKHIILIFITSTLFVQLGSAQLKVNSSNGYVTVGSTNNGSREFDVYGDALFRNESATNNATLHFWDIDGTEMGFMEFDNPEDHTLSNFKIEAQFGDVIIDGEDEVRFNTNDQFEMIIKKDGKIGMGTQEPSEILHVVGNQFLTGDLKLDGSEYIQWEEAGTRKAYLYYNGTNVFLENDETGGDIFIDPLDKFYLQTNGTTRFYVNEVGNAGFGTTALSGATVTIRGDSAGDGLKVIRDGSSVVAELYADINEASIGTVSNHNLRFLTNGGVKAQIMANGNFGIGTINAGEKLHVNGGIRIGAASGTANGTIRFAGGDIEGRVGGAWKSLTQTGGGGSSVWSTSGSTTFYSSGNVAIGTNSAAQELAVAGDIGLTGEIVGISDVRVKKNINAIPNAMDIVKALNPVTYEYRNEDFSAMSLPEGKQFGLIAQEVESVVPEMVTAHSSANNMALKGINYNELIPVLTKAIQEQSTLIETQQKMLEDQQKQIDELKALHK